MTENILKVGDKAPEFKLTGDNYEDVALSSFLGKNVVLYFYPKDDTPGCTLEAKDFSCMVDEFEKANTVVLGVSKDDTESHEDFKKKYDLTFTLLSDEDALMLPTYGVWAEKNMYGKKYMGIERSTFLIDEKGIIKNIWRKVKVDGHAKEVLEAAKAL